MHLSAVIMTEMYTLSPVSDSEKEYET